jgi:hypothetical protein
MQHGRERQINLNVLVRKNHGQTVTDATEGRTDGKIILKMIQTSGIN